MIVCSKLEVPLPNERNFMKLCLPALLPLLIISVASCAAQTTPSKPQPTVSPLYAKAHQMTASVITPDLINHGSAVWLGDSGYLATCYHVVKDIKGKFFVAVPYDDFIATGEHMVLSATGSKESSSATVVAFNEATDVAILKARMKPSQFGGQAVSAPVQSETPQSPLVVKGAALAGDFPTEGAELLIAGFPLDGHSLIISKGLANGEAFPLGAGSRTAIRILISATVNPGNSGGPVIDSNGGVVGLMEGRENSLMKDTTGKAPQTCGRVEIGADGNAKTDATGKLITTPEVCNENSGISYAVPARFITELARENKLVLD
jgi:S1-C subfamily serine protease